MIETLDEGNQFGATETLAEAFGAHPMLPPGRTKEQLKRFFDSLLHAFRNAPDARLFAIRRDEQFDCVAFVCDAEFEPRGWQLLVLLMRAFRTLGWRMVHAYARVFSQKPEYQERQLELFLIGTRSESQRQGLGRIVLRHIYEYAANNGYDSVVLEVAKETPAFTFYLADGFEQVKEITLPTTQLCFLRRPIVAEKA